jgi:hypothetical protein
MYGTNIEQVKDAHTPEEMRAEIYRMGQYDPMVRSVLDTADYNGMSAEDKYTVMSYMAVKQLNELKKLQMEFMLDRPATPVHVTAKGEGSQA